MTRDEAEVIARRKYGILVKLNDGFRCTLNYPFGGRRRRIGAGETWEEALASAEKGFAQAEIQHGLYLLRLRERKKEVREAKRDMGIGSGPNHDGGSECRCSPDCPACDEERRFIVRRLEGFRWSDAS